MIIKYTPDGVDGREEKSKNKNTDNNMIAQFFAICSFHKKIINIKDFAYCCRYYEDHEHPKTDQIRDCYVD